MTNLKHTLEENIVLWCYSKDSEAVEEYIYPSAKNKQIK